MTNKLYNRAGREISVDDVLASIPSGWHHIAIQLMDELFAIGWDGVVWQTKEKFGGLRFYTGTAPENSNEIIEKAEDKSIRTCQQCGEPGKRGTWGNKYYVSTLCDKHIAEEEGRYGI